MKKITPAAKAALDAANLVSAVSENIRLLARSGSEVAARSIAELAGAGQWREIVDRFWCTLKFGTGGLRGRTIGRVVTAAERDGAKQGARPGQPCTGTNAMNYFNISRAAQGLATYCLDHFKKHRRKGRPLIVIAHDTRHFSREFAELVARVVTGLGCDAGLFDGPRSTPELSFAVRHLDATAGVVITASHNPSHDNGFKCYFDDGAQVIEPHAGGIVARVNALTTDAFKPVPKSKQGRLRKLGADIDRAYMARLETLVLDPAMVRSARGLRVVFTSIHGTGGVISCPMLRKLGFRFSTVKKQDAFDGDFPTVESPNPENAEALTLAIAQAEKERADVVIATDPDCDRMGVAIRNAAGKMQLLTGNQIGSLIAAYRVRTLVAQGVITPENAARCAIIKTLVTTDLQRAIAERHGLRCVETLTGFKYIGEKLGQYEAAIPAKLRGDYRRLDEEKTRALRLAHSTYYVAGGEESYGYSAHDFVRDKDGNAAVVLFAEVCAYAKTRGLTVDALLDEVYAEYGFHLEKNGTITFEGADGAAKIAKLAASYATHPPAVIHGSKVTRVRDFKNRIERDARGRITRGPFKDVEGQALPIESMTIFDLADGRRIAVRPSGTEPKIKFYLFARREPKGPRFTAAELARVKRETAAALDALWAWLQRDVEKRA